MGRPGGALRLLVRYVDGQEVEVPPGVDTSLRRFGVDFVDLGAYRMQGKSVYWVRRVGSSWAVGGGVVTEAEEAIANPDGTYDHRRLEHMPDVESVLLGWWLP